MEKEKKGFFSKIMGKMDKKMKEKSECSCCCSCDEPEKKK